MGFISSVAMVIAAAGLSASAEAPRCLTTPIENALYTHAPVELCDPAHGCAPFLADVVAIDGCLGFPAVADDVDLLGESLGADSIQRRFRARHVRCAPEIVATWTFRERKPPSVAIEQRMDCGLPPTATTHATLRVAERFDSAPHASVEALDDGRPMVTNAAIESLLQRQEIPEVCTSLRAVLDDATEDEPQSRQALVHRILAAAVAPCFVDSVWRLFIDDTASTGVRDAAEKTLSRLLESPEERFLLVVDAARHGRSARAIVGQLPSPMPRSHVDTLFELLHVPASGASANQRLNATFLALETAIGPRQAALEGLGRVQSLHSEYFAALFSRPSVQGELRDLSAEEIDRLFDVVDAAPPEATLALARGALLRVRVGRELTARTWRRVAANAAASAELLTALERTLSCKTLGAARPQIPADVAATLLDVGASVSCVEIAANRALVAVDPTDFDAFAKDAPPTPLRGTPHEDTAPPPAMHRVAPSKAPSPDSDVIAAAPTLRAETFSDGFSIAPFGAAIAHVEGPLVGGGLLGSWALSERFSVVGLATAMFSCGVCRLEGTGARTDLRLDVGASVVAFPQFDFGPYARATLGVSHIEIVDFRRGSFHDVVGPEATVGIEWIPIFGARLFLELGGFWMWEFSRSVRPEGQLPPSPQGIAPVDGSSFGVVARFGAALRL